MRRKGLVRGLVAGATALVLGLAGAGPATAGLGGGGGGGGSGGSAFGGTGMLVLVNDRSDIPQGWGQVSIDFFWNTAVGALGTSVVSGQAPQPQFYDVCTDAINNAIAATPGATTARVVALALTYDYVNTGWIMYGAGPGAWNPMVDARFNASGLVGWPIYENGSPITSDQVLNLLHTSDGSTRIRCVAANNLQLSRYKEERQHSETLVKTAVERQDTVLTDAPRTRQMCAAQIHAAVRSPSSCSRAHRTTDAPARPRPSHEAA